MKKLLIQSLIVVFGANSLVGVPLAHANELNLPVPGHMVALSPVFSPVVLKGIKLDPSNPLNFDFFFDRGDVKTSNQELKGEFSKLIKYFLASLAIPEGDLWVNLSPYEKNRIVPHEFGQTIMGRDLLAQDYILKQVTASLIYPEAKLGKEFWREVYKNARSKLGTTQIPINTFNKVWIVPEKAVIYEHKGTAFVLENHLKVMLEEDYLSLGQHTAIDLKANQHQDTNRIGNRFVRELIIPALTKEVNSGKNFAPLRQVFSALILAIWYKMKIKNSIINEAYSNQKKIMGLDYKENTIANIYSSYLKAFKKGVFNYIKEEPDTLTEGIIPRKYFSGGVAAEKTAGVIRIQAAMTSGQWKSLRSGLVRANVDLAMDTSDASQKKNDKNFLIRLRKLTLVLGLGFVIVSVPIMLMKIYPLIESNNPSRRKVQLATFEQEYQQVLLETELTTDSKYLEIVATKALDELGRTVQLENASKADKELFNTLYTKYYLDSYHALAIFLGSISRNFDNHSVAYEKWVKLAVNAVLNSHAPQGLARKVLFDPRFRLFKEESYHFYVLDPKNFPEAFENQVTTESLLRIFEELKGVTGVPEDLINTLLGRMHHNDPDYLSTFTKYFYLTRREIRDFDVGKGIVMRYLETCPFLEPFEILLPRVEDMINKINAEIKGYKIKTVIINGQIMTEIPLDPIESGLYEKATDVKILIKMRDVIKAKIDDLKKHPQALFRQAPGGIDLNPAQMSIEDKNQGNDFTFNFQTPVLNMFNLLGINFTIESVNNVTNLSQILELK